MFNPRRVPIPILQQNLVHSSTQKRGDIAYVDSSIEGSQRSNDYHILVSEALVQTIRDGNIRNVIRWTV